MQEALLADPALLLDEDAVHHRDLPGRAAEAVERDARPGPQRLAERHACPGHREPRAEPAVEVLEDLAAAREAHARRRDRPRAMPSSSSATPAVSGRPNFPSLRSMSCTTSATARSAASLMPDLVEQHLERAAIALVRELGVVHVEADLAGLRAIAARRNELEARLRIEEAADQPRAGDPIDVDTAACHPRPPGELAQVEPGRRGGIAASGRARARIRAAIASSRPSATSRPGASKKSIAIALASCASSRRSSAAARGGEATTPAQRRVELRRALGDPLVVGRARGVEERLDVRIAQPFERAPPRRRSPPRRPR